MSPRTLPTRWLNAGAAVAITALASLFGASALPTLAGASSRPSTASPAAVATCTSSSTEVWAAFKGSGTAGTTYYVLEISNVGTKRCTLEGYASVTAFGASGALVGVAASHRGTPALVTLAPGATAHVVLGVTDTGALCGSSGVATTGLRVVPPGESKPIGEEDEITNFPLTVCSHQSSMSVLSVHAGTGIPLYTVS
jgi:hypothetical protein